VYISVLWSASSRPLYLSVLWNAGAESPVCHSHTFARAGPPLFVCLSGMTPMRHTVLQARSTAIHEYPTVR
jgi:hypothetical protein